MTVTQDVRAALGDDAAHPQADVKRMPATAESVTDRQASTRPRLPPRPVATATKQVLVQFAVVGHGSSQPPASTALDCMHCQHYR